MLILGLTGGIASGKSFVANLLAEKGAKVINADRFAHDVLTDKGVVDQLTDRWGMQVMKPDGSLNRFEIAKIVFADSDEATVEMKFLEDLVHPRVRQKIEQELILADSEGYQVAVLDIPLLHESGWSERCDFILHVDTPLEVRQSRALERGWTKEEHAKREARQLSIDEKLSRADHTISGENQQSATADIVLIWDKITNPGQSS